MDNLMVETKFETTASQQGVASSFCTQTPQGFGYLPSSVRFDPTHECEHSLHGMLIPTQEEIDGAPRLRLCGEKAGLQSWGETEASGVTSQLNDACALYPGLQGNGQSRLNSRNLGEGIASGTSYEDFHHSFGNHYLSVLENKGAEGSILAAISQAAVTGSNFAMNLLSKGLSSEQCVVPIIGNTGIIMAFGAVIILKGSFPTYIPISKKLDLLDAQEGQIASAYLMKATNHCRNIANVLRETCRACPLKCLTFEPQQYFVKRLTNEVFARGLGLFENNCNINNVQPGLFHMCDVLNLIYNSPARCVVEFPLSIRTPDNESDNCYELIYRDITHMGYTMGCPNRINNAHVYILFKDALKTAVNMLHEAGVLHGDLYFSNVMWKLESDETVQVKIVDWDAAHCLNENDFVPKVRAKLVDYLGESNVQFGVRHDLLYLSVLDIDIDEANEGFWLSLASQVKNDIDQAYRSLLSIVLENM
jgi:hypothetical protein